MSNKAITWAYSQTLKAGTKFVLVTLADMADQDDSCYPGIDTLAKLTGFGPTAIRGHIDALIKAGYVTTERRHKRNGARTSDRYYLQLDASTRNTPDAGPSALQDETAESEGTSEAPNAGFRAHLTPDSEAPNAGFRRAYKDEPSVEPQGMNPETGHDSRTPVRPVATARLWTDQQMSSEVQAEAQRAGIGNLARVGGMLADTVRDCGALTPTAAIRLVEAIVARSKAPVRDVTGYVIRTIRNTPDEVRDLYETQDLVAYAIAAAARAGA